MENLIRISDKGLVSAKELYLGLGLNKTNWSRWYPKNIQSNEFFKENIDWIGVRHNDEGNETMDFAISIEFAKHIAMMAKTEKSHEYRNYFIKCENKLKEDKPQCIEDLIILQAQSLKDLRLQLEETKEQTTAVKQEVQNMKDVITINPSEEWRKKQTFLLIVFV
ncbi:antA/AntB antirepressor family protein [Clostridium acetobutylicum]|uniref:antA/AntB antirepressor family protein n=1 Tax=Clostridium acetobutylicum TaxID=1488 RepID=UPI001F4C3C34|nr:antA/AntB antirepressor family protein [Clostridium acetobutylicum]NRY58849.1 anti-repressor protein [Clostridium acetobutylicum]